MTKEKLEELRKRMLNHDVENDVAIVKITAKELCDLLDHIDELEKRARLFAAEVLMKGI